MIAVFRLKWSRTRTDPEVSNFKFFLPVGTAEDFLALYGWLEKLLNIHSRDIMAIEPVHRLQYAYRKDMSTETATAEYVTMKRNYSQVLA